MHHLELLAPQCAAALSKNERVLPPRQHDTGLISRSVRSVFREIATFLARLRRSESRAALAESAQGASTLARVAYELAIGGAFVEGPQRLNWERCLEALESLPDTLTDGRTLPHWELAHAMDTLIGLLVQLDHSTSVRSAARFDRTRMRPSAKGRTGRSQCRAWPRTADADEHSASRP